MMIDGLEAVPGSNFRLDLIAAMHCAFASQTKAPIFGLAGTLAAPASIVFGLRQNGVGP
jgi:hypothetical protein